MQSSDKGHAIQLSNGEMGANQDVSFQDSGCVRNENTSGNIDWSGTMALTASDGYMQISNTDVYGDLDDASVAGFYRFDDVTIVTERSSTGSAVEASSDAPYFSDGKISKKGNFNGGVDGARGDTDLSELADEIDDWQVFIDGLTPEHTYTNDIQNKGTFVIELLRQGGSCDDNSAAMADLCYTDTNGDGIVTIKINRGSDDWNLGNSDIVFVGDEDVTAIIFTDNKVLGSNTSIQRCSNGPGLLLALGAGVDNDDGSQGFTCSNCVINNVAIWELSDGSDADGDHTITCSNCQGCSQFIADQVDFSNNRWTRCPFGVSQHTHTRTQNERDQTNYIYSHMYILSFFLKCLTFFL